MDIMDELMLHARRDSWYQQCLAEVNEKEPAFLEIRNSLSEEQQEMLDDSLFAGPPQQGHVVFTQSVRVERGDSPVSVCSKFSRSGRRRGSSLSGRATQPHFSQNTTGMGSPQYL